MTRPSAPAVSQAEGLMEKDERERRERESKEEERAKAEKKKEADRLEFEIKRLDLDRAAQQEVQTGSVSTAETLGR